MSDPPPQLFRPGGHVAASFSASDFIQFKIGSKRNLFGDTMARYFEHEGRRIAIEGKSYKELVRLTRSVQKTNAYRDFVSTKWVEDTIIDWMQAKYEATATPSLSAYLGKRFEEDVREHEIWMPVSHLSLESTLRFGNVVFKTISKEIMDDWYELWQKGTGNQGAEYAAKLDMRFARLRKDLQGLAAATVKVKAEPERAFEVALRESELAVAALRIYHTEATLFPEITSYCTLLGRENVKCIKPMQMEGTKVLGWSERPLGQPVLKWHLSDNDIRKYTGSWGFDEVNRLLALKNRTEFQNDLLDALLMYSRNTLEKDVSDRLVYMVVAIESMLLRSENESIQQNVGERMAFIIAKTVEGRKAAIRNLKATYALRSRYIHHGHTIEELETVRSFMINAWTLFTTLAKANGRFSTKEQLIDHLETMKLS